MKKYTFYISFIFFQLYIYASLFTLTAQTTKELSVEFAKYKSDHNPQEIFLNILKITNNSNQSKEFYVRFNVPNQWKLVTQNSSEKKIALQPGETTNIPVRVSMPKLTQGGIAYILSAELLGTNENLLIPQVYCYINIPRISDWKMKAEDRYLYVSEHEFFKTVKIHFENNGNAEENIKISLELGNKLGIVGFNAKKIETGILLKPYTDSTVEFMVKYNDSYKDLPSIRDNRMVVYASNDAVSTPKNITFWFEKVESIYENELTEDESPLIIWADLFNLLTQNGFVNVQAGFTGNIYLKDKSRLSYYFWNGNILNTNTPNTFGRNYYQFSRMYLEYSKKSLRVRVGDIFSATWNVPFNGRGISANYTYKKHHLFGALTRNIFNPVWTIGLQDSYQYNSNLTLYGSLGYRLDNFRNINSVIPTLGASYRYKTSSIMALFSPAIVNFNGDTRFGYGHIINYNGKYLNNKLSAYLNNRFRTQYFLEGIGTFNSTIGNASYRLDNAQSFTLFYNANYTNPSIIDPFFNIINVGKRDNHVSSLLWSKTFNNKLTFNGGPGYQHFYNENLLNNQPTYISNNYIGYVGVNVKGKKRQNSIAGNISLSYTDVSTFFNGITSKPPGYFSSSYLLNARFNKSGLMMGYYYGAPSYNSQIFFRENGRGNKSIRINPYYNQSFFQNKFHVNINATYWYQVNDKSSRTSMFSYLVYELGQGWSANANVLLYNYTRNDEETGRVTFSDVNMNFGFRKVFDIPQPHNKHYNVKIIFFKDLNGNRIKDENEVGLHDILVKLENKKDSLNISSSEYYDINLLSDQFGTVECLRLPEGYYIVTTEELMGTTEYLNQLGKSFEIYLGENLTVFVPFTKSNKVIGKVVIQRDPFSSLGLVSPGNIKITATDSVGNTYSCLTNPDGSFILYAPHSGMYRVSLKNIFEENFSLKQQEFIVDFNGLKEFNVTFLFEERKRKINFQGDVNGFDFANKNFEVNNESNSNSQNYGDFDNVNDIPKPVDKNKVRFKVQVGAFNTSIANNAVDNIRKIPNIEESKTPLGLTRFTIGSFTSLQEAEKLKTELLSNSNIQEKQFVIVIGEYAGRVITAEEASALLLD